MFAQKTPQSKLLWFFSVVAFFGVLWLLLFGGTAKADQSAQLTYWNGIPAIHYEWDGYFLEASPTYFETSPGVKQQYSLVGYSYNYNLIWELDLTAEGGVGWHEVKWARDLGGDDDLFVLGGVGLEYNYNDFLFALGYRYTNTNVDTDGPVNHVESLDGLIFSVGLSF